MKIASLCLLAVLLTGCTDSTKRIPWVRETNEVVAVFMHEPLRYSFLVRTPNGIVTETVCVTFNGEVTIKDDVPPSEKIWYEYKKNSWGYYFDLEIHLHSVSEINAAGWNHGKHGSGQTVILEKP